ncbi:hypothetical protein [Actinomadura atramentaria]|uniref:hypothetical protein n=1 Tax=Actinomadura atramentaria TaxID=1990 RepID=UPI00035C1CA5|nr:hypothetical protein [Actinomadura atramentaria]
MRGDSIEIIAVGDAGRTEHVTIRADRIGRRVEVVNKGGLTEVRELNRSGVVLRSVRYLTRLVLRIVEYSRRGGESAPIVIETTERRTKNVRPPARPLAPSPTEAAPAISGTSGPASDDVAQPKAVQAVPEPAQASAAVRCSVEGGDAPCTTPPSIQARAASGQSDGDASSVEPQRRKPVHLGPLMGTAWRPYSSKTVLTMERIFLQLPISPRAA